MNDFDSLAADYDALSARLAAVEKERDEAVALLRRFDSEEQDDALGVDLTALLARLADAARPEQEKQE